MRRNSESRESIYLSVAIGDSIGLGFAGVQACSARSQSRRTRVSRANVAAEGTALAPPHGATDVSAGGGGIVVV